MVPNKTKRQKKTAHKTLELYRIRKFDLKCTWQDIYLLNYLAYYTFTLGLIYTRYVRTGVSDRNSYFDKSTKADDARTTEVAPAEPGEASKVRHDMGTAHRVVDLTSSYYISCPDQNLKPTSRFLISDDTSVITVHTSVIGIEEARERPFRSWKSLPSNIKTVEP